MKQKSDKEKTGGYNKLHMLREIVIGAVIGTVISLLLAVIANYPTWQEMAGELLE